MALLTQHNSSTFDYVVHETTRVSCTCTPSFLNKCAPFPPPVFPLPSLSILHLKTLIFPTTPVSLHRSTLYSRYSTVYISSMAETRHEYYPSHQHDPTEKPPSTSQVLALALLLPLCAFLLFLAAITLTGTVVGIALTTPLFVIFSPVLLPAVLLIGLAVAGFLTSATFGVTSLASFTWMANYLRRARLSEQLENAKTRAQETLSQAAESGKEGGGEGGRSKVREAGQEAQSKAQKTQSGKA